MNNVTTVALRSHSLCCRSQPWPKAVDFLRRAFHAQCRTSPFVSQRSHLPWQQPFRPPEKPIVRDSGKFLHFSNTKRCLHTTQVLRKLKAYPEQNEEGLAFRDDDLSARELNEIFGRRRPRDLDMNRLLKVLQARRVDGTLDVPLDQGLASLISDFPKRDEVALAWLRANFPVDEDEAIISRFKREDAPREQEHPSALMARGQRLGLFKTQGQSMKENPEYYGPQSGAYYAELAEKEDDVFGKSQLERIRAENEARAEQEDRAWQERVERSMEEATVKAEQKSQAIAQRPEQGLEAADEKPVRPPNEFERWIIRAREKASSNLTTESPEVKNMTSMQRILPSLAFVLACFAGLYLFVEYWEPPRRSERMFPSTSLAFATCSGLAAANLGVFLLWRFPPALSMLNKFFIVIPGYPHALSMLGNTFSHFSFRHLATNMLGLYVFGPSLHEDIGRANFLAIYFGAGLLGSLISLSSFVLRGILFTSSMGSSGCVWGTMSAYMWLHKDDTFSFIFLPKEIQDNVKFEGWMFLIGAVVLDTVLGFRKKTVDVVAHLTGMLVGLAGASLWRSSHGEVTRRNRPGFFSRDR